ncbi:MAG: EamA family transporter [Proteobacteria bacterium]|nr:EamA family transporter [Pseudomonadota bacterium]MBU1057900.1 EamA family transporter [Pseudomonadota bacterium]
MKIILPIVFATIAAIGNAMFALGQKKSADVENGLVFVSLSALIAILITLFFAPLLGAFDVGNTVKGNWRAILLSGGGLFLTYLGFNLLYSRYGVSQYVLYAVISIITTTIFVGIWWLKEPVNNYHKIAIVLAILAVLVFSIGQSKT